METSETLKLEIKKLSSQAVQAKMDLHDLSEELPTGWERILEVAEKTSLTSQKLAEARRKLAALSGEDNVFSRAACARCNIRPGQDVQIRLRAVIWAAVR